MTQPLPLEEILAHANVLFRQGEYRAAIQQFEKAVATLQTPDLPPDSELVALSGMAACWGNLGSFSRQAEYATRLLNRARIVPHHFYVSMAAMQLAYALGMMDPRNHWPTIRATLDEGMESARAIADPQMAYLLPMELAKVAIDVKYDPAAINTWLNEALAHLPRRHKQTCFAVRYRVYRSYARLCRDQGDPDGAWEWGQAALEQAQSHGSTHFVHDVLALVAELDREQGRPDDALARAQKVIAASVTHKWLFTEHEGQAVRAGALLDLGWPGEAHAAASRALELARQLELREKEVTGLILLARVVLALEDEAQARSLLKEARRLAAERGYPDHAERAADLLVEDDAGA